ncbi:Tankyrase [Diplonema papillatum]|nr:Tankyrase [Diplonema papillatum]
MGAPCSKEQKGGDRRSPRAPSPKSDVGAVQKQSPVAVVDRVVVEQAVVDPVVVDTPKEEAPVVNKGFAELLAAVRTNDAEKVNEMLVLQQVADVNACDENGVTVLHCAVDHGYCNVVRCLLSHGAVANRASLAKRTVLHVAAASGSTEMLEILLADTSLLDTQDSTGNTPLHCAVSLGHDDIVGALVRAGASVFEQNDKGQTPLHIAAEQNGDSLVLCLLSAFTGGAEESATDTPATQTIKCNGLTIPAINLGGDVAARRAYDCLLLATPEQQQRAKECVDLQDVDGATALHYAAREGYEDIATMLLEWRATADLATKTGWTPLHEAAHHGRDAIIDILIRAGAPLTTQDDQGNTALHFAAERGRRGPVEMLVTALRGEASFNSNASASCQPPGANVANDAGKTPVDVAKNQEIKDILEGQQGLQTGNRRRSGSRSYGSRHPSVDLLNAEDLGSLGSANYLPSPRRLGTRVASLSSEQCVAKSGESLDNAEAMSLSCSPRFSEISCPPYDKNTEEGNSRSSSPVQEEVWLEVDDNEVTETPLKKAVFHKRETAVWYLVTEANEDVNEEDADGWSPLHIAAQEGATSIAAFLLEHGALVNKPNALGWSPLHSASFAGHDATVTLLLNHGADINATDSTGRTSLHYACRKGHDSVVRILVKGKADVDKANAVDLTPLGIAACNGREKIVRTLVESGADIDRCDHLSRNPLYFACRRGDVGTVSYLLEHGADLNKKNDEGKTPLHTAVYRGFAPVVALLLKNGAATDQEDKNAWLPVHIAAQEGSVEVVELLLKHEAKVNSPNNKGTTPLHAAVLQKHEAITKLFIDKGADLDSADKEGRTALHFAVLKRSLSITRMLVESGADVSKARNNGVTPLHYAANADDNLPLAKYLVEKGAAMAKGDKKGNTALHVAVSRGQKAVAKHLISAGAPVELRNMAGRTVLDIAQAAANIEMESLIDVLSAQARRDHALIRAVKSGDLEEARECLSQGSTVSCRDRNGDSILHVAALGESVGALILLLEAGADVAAVNSDEASPLHVACLKGKDDMVRIFLQHGADLRARDRLSRSPYHCAAEKGYEKVIRTLVQHEKKSGGEYVSAINAQDAQGRTPLYIATGQKKVSVVRFLLDNGADARVQDKTGKTAIHVAVRVASMPTLRLLVAASPKAQTACNLQDSDGNAPLHNACAAGEAEFVKLLFDNKADPYVTNSRLFTPLHAAVTSGVDRVVDLVLLAAKRLDTLGLLVNQRDDKSQTALHIACRNGSKAMVDKLLKTRVATTGLEDNKTRTALHWLAWRGFRDGGATCRSLLSAGAKCGVRDAEGKTPLHLAVERSNLCEVECLLSKGATVDAADQAGQTPLHYVGSSTAGKQIAKCLVQRGADVELAKLDDAAKAVCSAGETAGRGSRARAKTAVASPRRRGSIPARTSPPSKPAVPVRTSPPSKPAVPVRGGRRASLSSSKERIPKLSLNGDTITRSKDQAWPSARSPNRSPKNTPRASGPTSRSPALSPGAPPSKTANRSRRASVP